MLFLIVIYLQSLFSSVQIHVIITFIMYSRSSCVSMCFGSILCHLYRQFLQQVAVACCAMKTGCPRIGVCLPSLKVIGSAKFLLTKSIVCDLILSIPFVLMYSISFSFKWKELLNLELFNLSKIFVIQILYHYFQGL